MTLNKRETNIAIATGAAVVLGLLYYFAWLPYATALDDLDTQRNELVGKQKAGQLSLDRQGKLNPVWKAMRAGGLRNDSSTAESQFYAAILYWAQHARTSDPSFKTDPPKPDKDAAAKGFETVTFHVSVTGTLGQISELLWSIETATIPLRVLDVQLTPKKEGLDSSASPLAAQITIATLSMLPMSDQPNSALPISAAARAGAPAENGI